MALTSEDAIITGQHALDAAIADARQRAQGLDILRSGIQSIMKEKQDMQALIQKLTADVKERDDKIKTLLKNNNVAEEAK